MSTTSQGLDVGKMALEGFGQVMDSMDLVKRAWSNFSLATPFTPTLSVEELDKRIAELRAVEQWLSLNQNMLRNTIRGLEVQRGTLDAISTMSQSFGQMTKPADDALAQTLATFAAAAAQKAAAVPPTPTAGEAPVAGGFDWSPFGVPSSVFNRPQTAVPDAAAPRASAPGDADADADADVDEDVDADVDADVADADPASGLASPDTGAAAVPAPDRATAAAPAAMNPLAWWDMLQANFRQIAQAATLDGGAFAAAKPAGATRTAGAAVKAGAGRKSGKGARGTAASGADQASDSAPSSGKAREAAGRGRGGSRNKTATGRAAGTATGAAAPSPAPSPATSPAPATRQKRRKSGGAGGTG